MMRGNVRDEENAGRGNIPTPTKTDMCTSFSSFFPVSFGQNVFPSQPVAVKSEADAGIGMNPSLPSPPSPVAVDNTTLSHAAAETEQSGVLYSSDSGEAVGTLKLEGTDSTTSDGKGDYYNRPIARRSRKRSILKSFVCLSSLAVLMIGSVGFIASLFIFHPRRSEKVGPNNVNYTFEDGHNKTNTTQTEIEEGTSSSVVPDMISPTSSPTSDVDSLSPTSKMYSPSPTLSPMSLDPTPQASGSPSVSPSQYPTRAVNSIALEAVEDTFIMKGETQKEGKGNEKTFGKESTLRVKGGRDTTIVTIIRFDTTPLIKLGASVVRTKLRLFARTGSIFGGQITLARDDCSWTEKDTSWANAPDCILKTGVDISGQLDGWMGSDLLGWFSGDIVPDEWNETDLDWHPKQIPSQITLIISSDNEDGVTYASRNNDKNDRPRPPTMNIEYYTMRDDVEVI